MKLKRITFHNYRNFDHYELTLGRKVTIFIGRNGMGKTNLMDGMVQSLSFIFSKQRNTPQYEFIRSTAQGVKPFKATDPRYIHGDYTYPLSLEVVGEIANGTEPFELSWGFEQETQKSGLKDSKFREAYHAFWEYYQARDEKPVLAFYAAGFPHKDSNIGKAVKDRLKSGRPLPPSDGYYQWDKEQSCVNIWKKYYIQHWMNFRLHPTTENTRFVQAVNGVLQAFGTHINAASVVVDNPRYTSWPLITAKTGPLCWLFWRMVHPVLSKHFLPVTNAYIPWCSIWPAAVICSTSIPIPKEWC